MRRGLTSQSVVDFVAASGVASEKQILEWAKSSPAATVQMLLRKCEREGALKSRKVEENTVLFWAPAAQETAASQQVEARAQEPSADKVEEEIAALLWVNDVYDKEVKGHMVREKTMYNSCVYSFIHSFKKGTIACLQ